MVHVLFWEWSYCQTILRGQIFDGFDGSKNSVFRKCQKLFFPFLIFFVCDWKFQEELQLSTFLADIISQRCQLLYFPLTFCELCAMLPVAAESCPQMSVAMNQTQLLTLMDYWLWEPGVAVWFILPFLWTLSSSVSFDLHTNLGSCSTKDIQSQILPTLC